MKYRSIATLAILLLAACATHPPKSVSPFRIRGVWVATVNNIDWPSKRGLPSSEQQEELIRIFDRAVALGLNAVFLQVRPAADAIYPAANSPWTEYLSGTAGQPPEPAYDPLAFAVTEAHKRGLELHAWFNPFRAKHASSTSAIPPSHVASRRPDAVRPYGNQLWLDPGDAEARAEVIGEIVDVVKRYDVDGVHVDDYFYPYPETADGAEIAFPDEPTWSRYQEAGGPLNRSDWRRDNINRFVEAMYARVKAARSDVEVGISPFGIWRPNHPSQIRGFDAYEKIYADSRLWLQQGWVDYLAPQLYWPIDQKEQSFPALLTWWLEQDVKKRGIVVGMSVSRVANGRPNAITADEIGNQLEVTRKLSADGFILFSARALMEDRGGVNGVITDELQRPTTVFKPRD